MRKTDKQKNNLLTKEYLDKKLRNFATKSDFDKLDEKIDKVKDGLIFYIDEKLKPLEEMGKSFFEFKDSVLATLDKLVGMFEKFDQERIVASHQFRRINDKVENHDKRITVLEEKVEYKIS